MEGLAIFKDMTKQIGGGRQEHPDDIKEIELGVAARLLEADLAAKKRKAEEAGIEFKEPRTKKGKAMKKSREDISALLDDIDEED